MNTITVEKREEGLKAKQLRRTGKVPCAICGAGQESVSGQLGREEALKLFRTNRIGSKVTLEYDGKALLAQIKDRDVDTVKGELLHITFQALQAGQKTNSVAHILLANDEKLTEQLEKLRDEVPYAALPADMVDTVTLDLDGLAEGTVITVGDIPAFKSDKIELLVDPGEVVLRINSRRLMPAPDAVEEAAPEEAPAEE